MEILKFNLSILMPLALVLRFGSLHPEKNPANAYRRLEGDPELFWARRCKENAPYGITYSANWLWKLRFIWFFSSLFLCRALGLQSCHLYLVRPDRANRPHHRAPWRPRLQLKVVRPRHRPTQTTKITSISERVVISETVSIFIYRKKFFIPILVNENY